MIKLDQFFPQVNERFRIFRKLNTRYKEVNIKQQEQVTYLGCALDESMSGESMTLKIVNKINEKLKFPYRKSKFLAAELGGILCNKLIQSHFDYECTAWYSNLTKKIKKKTQIIQNKCNVLDYIKCSIYLLCSLDR